MQICALVKTTLLDYPRHVAATIFLGGCNFRCPYCHNRDIVFADAGIANGTLTPYAPEELFAFLEKRKTVLTGVCVTGGEPTLHPELPALLTQIKQLGYSVKLDTNGSNPDMLKRLIENRLIDYCAMDIKNTPAKYGISCGLPGLSADSALLARIRESADILVQAGRYGFDCEFRTTLVKELHTEFDMHVISDWLAGARAYYLQSYTESDGVIAKGFHAHDRETLETFAGLCRKAVPNTQIRGVEL
ncbi:MAG: anaerobic ribonucleoside-triphosphate reductase activating protein [Roseburia sp.]|nr:anaerobic ribonucleoside-triphosphate reductase activating protein [Roseburia sp.]